MSIINRINLALRARATKVLAGMEDPCETLDYSYQRQVELLTKVRRGVADTGASRARLEAQVKALHREYEKLKNQAGLEPGADGERQARRRKGDIEEELPRLVAEQNSIRSEEERLCAARDRLQLKVETFRARKESFKSTNTAAAEVHTKVSQTWSGLIKETDDTGADLIPYPRQSELLTQIQSSLEMITASRERLDRELETLHQWQIEIEDQAGQTASAEKDDLSQLASEQQLVISRLITSLAAQRNFLNADEKKFIKLMSGLRHS